VRKTAQLVVCLLVAGCGVDPHQSPWEGPGSGKADDPDDAPVANWQRDILFTSLRVDLAAKRATAYITLAPSAEDRASFDVKGLDVREVRGEGGPLDHRVIDGRLDVTLAADESNPSELEVDYSYAEREELEGATTNGLTFTWPYYCGNLFPCKPDPADGLRFTLALENVPAGKLAVYPSTIPTDAPSYMLGWAVGDYTYRSLGKTPAGTEVGVWWLPGEQEGALEGTADLVQIFDWLEKTVGTYRFGDKVGAVSARWRNAYGGMEHHPFWHVDSSSMDDLYIHAHEAAHGWFGDGIRIRCWEDFVLSEGPTSYLAARAMSAVGGPAAEKAIWQRFRSRLQAAVSSTDVVAWPQSCNKLDILKDDIYTSIPYMKGAFFLRSVELKLGRAALDRAIARFYAKHVNKAARMRDLIDAIKDEAATSTTVDPDEVEALATTWLRSTGMPALPPMP